MKVDLGNIDEIVRRGPTIVILSVGIALGCALILFGSKVGLPPVRTGPWWSSLLLWYLPWPLLVVAVLVLAYRTGTWIRGVWGRCKAIGLQRRLGDTIESGGALWQIHYGVHSGQLRPRLDGPECPDHKVSLVQEWDYPYKCPIRGCQRVFTECDVGPWREQADEALHQRLGDLS